MQFRNHEIIGDIVPLAKRYADEGADELVFYDITASSDGRVVDKSWVSRVAEVIDIPFCVAGGISRWKTRRRSSPSAPIRSRLTPLLSPDPTLITRLADRFGVQCIVVGIDTWFDAETGKYHVNQYTGDESRTRVTQWETLDWVEEVQKARRRRDRSQCDDEPGRGAQRLRPAAAGEGSRGVPRPADRLRRRRALWNTSLEAFRDADVDGALAASVFHKQIINIGELKAYLAAQGVEIRVC